MSYNQQTLDAMKIIVNSELDKRKYDITLVCEIIGEDENNKNRFLVKSDSMKFYAMLLNTDGYTTYRIGDTVNVLVPNGDYTLTKFITGKYSSNDEIPIVSEVLHPSVGFAAVRSVDAFELDESGVYVRKLKENDVALPDRLSGRAHLFKKEGKTQYIYLSANVKSNVESFLIKCTIEGKDINGEDITGKYLIWHSEDMMGNISNMPSGFPQEILLTSTELQEYNEIINVVISIENIIGTVGIANPEVTLSDTSFAIGYLTKDIEDGVYIYTMNDNYEYADPASKNIYAFAIKDKLFIFPSTGTFYWYLYTEGYSTTEEEKVTSEENKILWKKIDYKNPIQLHIDKTTSTIKVEYIEEEKGEKKIVYSTTQQFINTKYKENAKGSGTLLLTTDQTYCPIYDNYGKAIISDKKIVTAKRGDLSPFNTESEDIRIGEKYITWKFDLESQIKFPYSIVKKEHESLTLYEWYPELPKDYVIYLDTDEGIIKIEPSDKEWHASESGFAYVTQKISEAAAAPSISFYFKDDFRLNQNNILTAFTHTNEMPDPLAAINKGEISFTLGFGDNSGTGYAFNIINEDKEYPFFTNARPTKTFSVILQNKNGEKINLSEYQDKIRWTWLYDELHLIDSYKLLDYSKNNEMTDLYYQIFSENQKRNGLYKKQDDTYIEIIEWPTANQDVYTKKSTPLGETCVIEYINDIEDSNSKTIRYNFHVLVATLLGFLIENGLMINLQAFYPIGITGKDQTNILSLQGSTYAIYDSFGKLVNLNDKDKKYVINVINNTTEITKIIQYSFNNEKNIILKELNPLSKSLFSEMWEPTPMSICLYNNNDNILYMPLLSVQNTWFSLNINAWDGKLKIDNEGNYILSAMIGAGTKNANNLFTGVIMGDVGKDIRNAESGIYGFKDGKRTFSVSAKSGDAYFDGNVVARSLTLGMNNTQQDFNDYMTNFSNDITNSIDEKGFYKVGNEIVSEDSITPGSLPESKTAYFKVDSKGLLYAKNAVIGGTIYAGQGEIGGWGIHQTYLESYSEVRNSNEEIIYYGGIGLDINAINQYIPALAIGKLRNADKTAQWDAAAFQVDGFGNIKATAGEIGGWEIHQYYLVKTNNDSGKGVGLNMGPFGSSTTVGSTVFAIGSGVGTSGNWDSAEFRVTGDGKLHATAGSIAGWNIYKNSLETLKGNWYWYDDLRTAIYYRQYGVGINLINLNSTAPVFAIGQLTDGIPAPDWNETPKDDPPSNYENAAFRIDGWGKLYATGAVISGHIEATSGKFKGELDAATGKFSGNLTASSTKFTKLYIDNNNFIDSTGIKIGTDYARLVVDGAEFRKGLISLGGAGTYIWIDTTSESHQGGFNGNWNMTPTSTLSLNGNVSSASALSTDSDANLKNSIEPLSQNYDTLFDSLIPRLYKYNDGTSNRIHTGLIAQEVKSALDKANIPTSEFAGYVEIKDDTMEDGIRRTLRYEEFIALCIDQIQKLKTRVRELEGEKGDITNE